MKILNYIERDSCIHRMNGAAKLFLVIAWICSTMISFHTPFLLITSVLGFVLFAISKIKLSEQKGLLIFILCFVGLNMILFYLFEPEHGVEIYGSRHVLFQFSEKFTVTTEQLLYQANVCLKYITSIPIILIFVSTTQPSEMASSMNKIGIPYTISYAFSLAMRYIPITISDFIDISRSQQARGLELSSKENIIKRIKSTATMVIPLILTSVDKIEIITNAMELRKFGTRKTRTWIKARPFRLGDYLTILLGCGMIAFVIIFNITNGSRFWNPIK